MKTAPAFQFYASDTMADRRFRLMSLEERGLLITLQCECWVNRSVPSDLNELGKWLGFQTSAIEKALSERVLSFFEEDSGNLISPELEKYRKEIEERRAKQSEGGRKGGINGAKAKQEKNLNNVSLPNSYPSGHPQGSRVEMNRDEKNRSELSIKAVDTEIDPWVSEYDKASNGY